jgi:hypothetical protein
MAEQRFQPTDDFKQMLNDLLVIAEIPSEQLAMLAGLLGKEEGFTTDSRLQELIVQSIGIEDQQVAAFNALQNLSATSIDQVLNAVGEWRKLSPQGQKILSDDKFSDLEKNLSILIQDVPPLTRMRKAERLSNVLAHELMGVAIICDLRPLFNENRDHVEGLIPVTTMKVVYEKQNGLVEEIELVLSEKQLEDLSRRTQQAKQKLAVLRESVERWIPGGCVKIEE